MRIATVIASLLLLGARAAFAAPTETEIPNVTAEVVELRSSGSVTRLAVRYVNGTDKEAETKRFEVNKVVLVDVKSKKKHFPIKELVLPDFLPMEGVPIEGLGGASAGGIAAAGQTLGLEGALKELKAEVTPQEIKIDLSADVLFDFDQATIKKEAEPSLRNVATVLKANPGAAVAIEGHTDAKGAEAYNQTLSEQRAASVKQWLVTNAQVNGASIATRGWGKSKPVAENTKPDGSDEPEGRARNRRVQIVVRKNA